MTYQRDRESFLLTMQSEGMPPDIARRILRHAQTVQRCAELACSSEAADRDRVPCHGDVPRIAVTSARAEARIRELCETASDSIEECGSCGAYHRAGYVGDCRNDRERFHDWQFTPVFSGDPRGACVKIRVPSGKSDSWGGDGICVPTRSLPASAFR